MLVSINRFRVEDLQFCENCFRFFRGRWVSLFSSTRCEGSQSKEDQCIGQVPTLWDVILYGNVAVAQAATGKTDALGNLLNA